MGLKHLVAGALLAPATKVLTDQAIKWATNAMSPTWTVLDTQGRWLFYVSVGDGVATAVGAGGALIGKRRLKPGLYDFGVGALIGEAAHKLGETLVQLAYNGYLGAPPLNVDYQFPTTNVIRQAQSSWSWPVMQGRMPSPVTEEARFLPFQTDMTY